MKGIGEKLKEAREEMGITVDEAAEDLKMRPSQIENIEAGNLEAFQDIFYLKYFIRDYSKYLGLDKDEMVDEFNEYLFDYTSKISLDDIKKATKQEKEENKIKSPYTVERKRERVNKIIGYAAIIILLAVIVYFLLTMIFSKPKENDAENVVRGVNYESTK